MLVELTTGFTVALAFVMSTRALGFVLEAMVIVLLQCKAALSSVFPLCLLFGSCTGAPQSSCLVENSSPSGTLLEPC